MADDSPKKTRFAPSPTGPLHLGHARTHLVTWLFARSSGARIVMRIEDLDRPRVRPDAVSEILRAHEFLGLDYDEGPSFQHDRGEAYDAAIAELGDRVYPCTCSRKEIESVASAPHDDEGPVYPGTCRNGPTHPERPAALRFRMPEPESFVDRIAGECRGLGGGDIVVKRADGVFSYQLAVVVDDSAAGITDVIRGADLLASTPRQIALLRALGRRIPQYAHVPLVRTASGERLAKRTGARAILDYRDAGVDAESIHGVLAYSLGLIDRPEPTTLAELLPRFDFARIAPRAIDADAMLRERSRTSR